VYGEPAEGLRVSEVSAAPPTITLVPAIDPAHALHRLAGGDPTAMAEIVEVSRTSHDPTTLVVAALFVADDGALLVRAGDHAVTTRERQTVAIAAAHLRGDRDLVDALARDHLTEHPDSVLVAWIAGAGARSDQTNHNQPKETT
jgi:hypothetical protein